MIRFDTQAIQNAKAIAIFGSTASERLSLARRITTQNFRNKGIQQLSSMDELEEQFMQSSLFSVEECFAVDYSGRGNVFSEERFQRILAHTVDQPFFLLADSNLIKKSASAETYVLDFTQEKFWDKKKRYQIEVLEWAKENALTLDQPVIDHLVSLAEESYGLMEQEREKMLCFLRSEKRLDSQVLKKIGCSHEEYKLFQLAEEIVWREEVPSFPHLDEGGILQLIRLLRYQLVMAMQTAQNLAQKGSEKGLLAKYSAKKIRFYQSKVQEKGVQAFEGALASLLELQQLVRTKTFAPKRLWDEILLLIRSYL